MNAFRAISTVKTEAEALLRFGAKAGACLAGQALLFKAPRNLCAAPEIRFLFCGKNYLFEN